MLGRNRVREKIGDVSISQDASPTREEGRGDLVLRAVKDDGPIEYVSTQGRRKSKAVIFLAPPIGRHFYGMTGSACEEGVDRTLDARPVVMGRERTR